MIRKLLIYFKNHIIQKCSVIFTINGMSNITTMHTSNTKLWKPIMKLALEQSIKLQIKQN